MVIISADFGGKQNHKIGPRARVRCNKKKFVFFFVLLLGGPAAKGGGSSKWMPLPSANSSNSDKEDPGEMAKDMGSEKDVLRGAVGGAKSVDAGADNRQQVNRGPVDIRENFFWEH